MQIQTIRIVLMGGLLCTGHPSDLIVASGKIKDINQRNDDGRTALMYASLRGYTKIVAALLRAGADLSLTDKDGKTAAQYAAPDETNKQTNKQMDRGGCSD